MAQGANIIRSLPYSALVFVSGFLLALLASYTLTPSTAVASDSAALYEIRTRPSSGNAAPSVSTAAAMSQPPPQPACPSQSAASSALPPSPTCAACPAPGIMTLPSRRTTAAQISNQCGVVLSEYIVTLDAQEGECTLDQLSTAMRHGYRNATDGVFYIQRCPLRWFYPHEVCTLFQQRNLVVITVGDSLVRHVTNGLFMSATGNFERGCVAYWDMPDENRRACSCAKAFEDHTEFQCRQHSVAFHRGDPKLICPQWDQTRIAIEYWYKEMHPYILQEWITNARVQGVTPIFYIHQGLHHDMEPAWAIPMLRQAAELFANQSAPAIPLLYATMPWTDEQKKPQAWVGTQNNARGSVLNDAIRQLAADVHANVFETFTFTMNATSYDGTHYDHRVNVPLAQVLLNYVEMLTRPAGATPPPIW